jgi:hypothetical protein
LASPRQATAATFFGGTGFHEILFLPFFFRAADVHIASVGLHAGYFLFSPACLPQVLPVLQSTHPFPPPRMNHPRRPYFFSKSNLGFPLTPQFAAPTFRHCTSAPLAYADGHTLYRDFTFL